MALKVVYAISAATFVLWLLGVLASVLAPALPFLLVIAAFATTTTVATVAVNFAATVALLITSLLNTLPKMHAKRLAYEEKVYKTLSAPYGKPEPDGTVLTKLKKFNQLQAAIKEKEDELAALLKKALREEALASSVCARKNRRGVLKVQCEASETYRELWKICGKNQTDNDDWFENQRLSPSWSTWVKKTLNRLLVLVTGMGNGCYIIRSFALVGGCLFLGTVGVSTGGLAGLAFGVAFLVAAVVIGTLRVVKYQLDKNQKHREASLDNIDLKISYSKKRNKELVIAVEIMRGELKDKDIRSRSDASTNKSERRRLTGTAEARTRRSIPSIATEEPSTRAEARESSAGITVTTAIIEIPPAAAASVQNNNILHLPTSSARPIPTKSSMCATDFFSHQDRATHPSRFVSQATPPAHTFSSQDDALASSASGDYLSISAPASTTLTTCPLKSITRLP